MHAAQRLLLLLYKSKPESRSKIERNDTVMVCHSKIQLEPNTKSVDEAPVRNHNSTLQFTHCDAT